jgi:hypothetical protein
MNPFLPINSALQSKGDYMPKPSQKASLLVRQLGTSATAPCVNQGNTSVSVAPVHRFKKAACAVVDRRSQDRISSRECGLRIPAALGWAAIALIACGSRTFAQPAGIPA